MSAVESMMFLNLAWPLGAFHVLKGLRMVTRCYFHAEVHQAFQLQSIPGPPNPCCRFLFLSCSSHGIEIMRAFSL